MPCISITPTVSMRHIVILIPVFDAMTCFGQGQNITGTYSNGIAAPKLAITFNADSTFTYISTEHPTFNRWENFSEKGKWTVSGDTIILNPQLANKPFVESDFTEQQEAGSDIVLYLTFNHIKRYFNKEEQLVKTDTMQVERLDYAFNELKKKKLARVAKYRTARCTFAGYIPPETITSNRTVVIAKPPEEIKSIFIGCFELKGTKEFRVKNPRSNHLTLNIYSNYYQEGQIRQKKLLIKNENVLYSRQKQNGKFDKGHWYSESMLKRDKSSS